jgi:voltage-gated potassium channel
MTPRQRIDRFINHPTTELGVAVLIVVSVCAIVLEFALLAQNSPWLPHLMAFNDGITAVFVVELVLRFIAERRKIRFFKRFWLDIIAVLPLLRAFRFLRILRVLRLFRVGIILNRQLRVFRNPIFKLEYVLISVAVLVVVVLGGISIRAAEGSHNSDVATLEQAFWFAAMTLVGGEPLGATPQTTFGRIVALTLMLAGLTVFAILAGTVSAVMVDTLRNVRMRPMEIDELRDHCIVCGWNRSAEMIIHELVHDRHYTHVVVVSERSDLENEPFFQKYGHQVVVVCGDFTRVDALRAAGIERARAAVLLADASKDERSSQDRDARTVLTAMLIEKLNPGIFSTVQLLNRDNETSLRSAGVEEIIVTDEYVGNIIGSVVRNRGMTTMLDELLTSRFGHQFVKERLPEVLVGKTVADALVFLKNEHNATLLAVARDERGKGMVVNPPGDMVLAPGTWMVVAATGALQN